ncbi:Eukaryotic translation initiation factor 5 [Hibiscus syriacus]|uniref:Eukaryotic translation initiation factor 5 n=1 Tax=Hibiscus syriacus TaxID=106335 RepID=A0A6A2W891_HIBSY|nr:Eukaryotic translation initiation factor 5 [Hibiscus syriacus]
MALQNIGASNSDDAFYRYKMPKMITKIEGRGNGIKTNVVNMVEIAKALARPASYATKYFGCELGAQSKFDERTGTSHNPPEAKKSSKDKKAMRRAEKERLKEGEAADEELKKIKKESKKKSSSTTTLKAAAPKSAVTKKKGKNSDEDYSPEQSQADENEAASGDDDYVQWQTDTSLEAAKQRIQEQLSAVTADMVMLTTSEEKKRSVKKSPEHDVKAPENVVSAHEKLVNEIKEHLIQGSSPTQLKSFLGSLSGASSKEISDALFTALFDDVGKGFAKEVTKKKNYLAAAAAAAATKEEGWQMMLLHSIESFCGNASPDAAKEVALVIKVLYDDDILEEEFIMEWYQKGIDGSNKSSQIWKNVKPFIEWLQNAESESEEESL